MFCADRRMISQKTEVHSGFTRRIKRGLRAPRRCFIMGNDMCTDVVPSESLMRWRPATLLRRSVLRHPC